MKPAFIIASHRSRQEAIIRKTTCTVSTILMIVFCAGGFFPAVSFSNQEDVLVTGDGIVITAKDLNAFKNLVESSSFRSSKENHLQAAIRTWLFAKEAISIGLKESGNTVPLVDASERVRQIVEASLLYMKKFIAEYPISDEAVLSYYYSHPDYDRPLDETLKKRIHRNIVRARQREIFEVEGKRLAEKYNLEQVVQ